MSVSVYHLFQPYLFNQSVPGTDEDLEGDVVLELADKVDHFCGDDLAEVDDVRHLRQNGTARTQQLSTVGHLVAPDAERRERRRKMGGRGGGGDMI